MNGDIYESARQSLSMPTPGKEPPYEDLRQFAESRKADQTPPSSGVYRVLGSPPLPLLNVAFSSEEGALGAIYKLVPSLRAGDYVVVRECVKVTFSKTVSPA
jgi:hypothetical protein